MTTVTQKDVPIVVEMIGTTLGASDSSGFLKLTTDLLGELEDPVTGALKSQTETVSEGKFPEKGELEDLERGLLEELATGARAAADAFDAIQPNRALEAAIPLHRE